jgi:hypothetical protein
MTRSRSSRKVLWSIDDLPAESTVSSSSGIHQIVSSSSDVASPVLRKRFCRTLMPSAVSSTLMTGKPT